MQVAEHKHTPCIFDLVYFARPVAFLDEVSVYKSRRRFGAAYSVQVSLAARAALDVLLHGHPIRLGQTSGSNGEIHDLP